MTEEKKRKRNIMKIKIEIDEGLPEDEVLIRCRGLTEQISDVQKAVSEVINTSQKFVFYRGNTEYYLTLDEILFFETDSDGINAHTRDNIYQTKYKLYELEELLPGSFMRISKSAIVNTSHIYSISRISCIWCGGICRHTQAGVCLKILLQTINQ